MAARSLCRPDASHSAALDWLLVLAGALFAWFFWPAPHH
jgi:hypothetical protein